MTNVIVVKRKRKTKITRHSRGEGIIRLDSEATDILEQLLAESGGQISTKDLASSMIKFAADNIIIKIEDETEEK